MLKLETSYRQKFNNLPQSLKVLKSVGSGNVSINCLPQSLEDLVISGGICNANTMLPRNLKRLTFFPDILNSFSLKQLPRSLKYLKLCIRNDNVYDLSMLPPFLEELYIVDGEYTGTEKIPKSVKILTLGLKFNEITCKNLSKSKKGT